MWQGISLFKIKIVFRWAYRNQRLFSARSNRGSGKNHKGIKALCKDCRKPPDDNNSLVGWLSLFSLMIFSKYKSQEIDWKGQMK